MKLNEVDWTGLDGVWAYGETCAWECVREYQIAHYSTLTHPLMTDYGRTMALFGLDAWLDDGGFVILSCSK